MRYEQLRLDFTRMGTLKNDECFRKRNRYGFISCFRKT